jgi:hypothetical protein
MRDLLMAWAKRDAFVRDKRRFPTQISANGCDEEDWSAPVFLDGNPPERSLNVVPGGAAIVSKM